MKNIVLFILIIFIPNFVFSNSYNRSLPLGSIKGSFPEYFDSDTVTIPVGYGECDGNYWEISSSTNLDITNPYANDFIYIYIDYSASSFPTPTFVASTDEPAWNESKMGWYRQTTGNENDRSIGVVWWNSTNNAIEEFNVIENKVMMTSSFIYQVLNNGNPNSTWRFLEASAYSPVNSTGVYVHVYNTDTATEVGALLRPSDNVFSRVGSISYSASTNYGWLDLERGSSRDFEWFGTDNDDNNFDVKIWGYRIER